MIFDRLREEDYVRLTDGLLENYHFLDQAILWEGEPQCMLRVAKLDWNDEDPKVYLECTNDCGGHAVLDIHRSEYETALDRIDVEMLEFVNFSNYVTGMNSNKVVEFSLAVQTQEILQMIRNGTLP